MKTQNPFTGRSSGSLANVVASTYLGQNILKSKPLEVRNPQTDKQVNVRNILKSAATLAKSLMASEGIAKRSARTGRSTQKTARTAMIQAILAKKLGVAPDITLGRDGISLQGFGIAPQSSISGSYNATSKVLQLSWSEVVPLGGSDSDKVSIALFDIKSGQAEFFNTSATRQDNHVSATATNPAFNASSQVAVFLMFDSADGTSYDAVVSKFVSLL